MARCATSQSSRIELGEEWRGAIPRLLRRQGGNAIDVEHEPEQQRYRAIGAHADGLVGSGVCRRGGTHEEGQQSCFVTARQAEVGQRFVIDLELAVDLSDSSHTDRLADTVSYSNVVAAATAAFKNANYKLLERAAGAVADAILAAFPRVSALTVTVHKPHAPIAAIFEDVGVILTRTRQPSSHG